MSESYSHTDADYDHLQLEVDRLRARVLKYEQQLTITADGFVMSDDGVQAYDRLRDELGTLANNDPSGNIYRYQELLRAETTENSYLHGLIGRTADALERASDLFNRSELGAIRIVDDALAALLRARQELP